MGLLFRRFADNRLSDSTSGRLRAQRIRVFLARLPAPRGKPLRILDIGGTVNFWKCSPTLLPGHLEITLLNREEPDRLPPGFRFMGGDARNLHQIADRDYDAVFSNSVIEHVGTWADQRAMAAEILRVGRMYFIQTPNRWFPIEPHFVFPMFQFLPNVLQAELHYRFNLGWMGRASSRAQARQSVRGIRLLSAGELRRLFPGSHIWRERVAGLAKSLVAWHEAN